MAKHLDRQAAGWNSSLGILGSLSLLSTIRADIVSLANVGCGNDRPAGGGAIDCALQPL
jgi:hypothetical protein